MHFKCNLYLIINLKCSVIICELGGVSMLHKQRSIGNFMLSNFISVRISSLLILSNWDILFTNLMAIENSYLISKAHRNCNIAFLRNVFLAQVPTVCKGFQWHKQSIGLFSTQLNGLNITLVWIKETSDVISIFILLTNKIILFTILFGQLKVYRKVHSKVSYIY